MKLDGKQVIGGGRDGKIKIWDCQSRNHFPVTMTNLGPIQSLDVRIILMLVKFIS